MTECAISLVDLDKHYGDVKALNAATLDVPHNTIFGFLGPNGAGKTTALRVIMGYLKKTTGAVSVLGFDPWRDRVELHARVGYVPGGMGFYEKMTGRDILDYGASLMRGRASESPLRTEALDALSVSTAVLERRISEYSKGMRQKLAVVQAVQHDPELLLLDEPSEGLDPLVQHSFYAFLRARRDDGRTIFFSSHTLSEVQMLCDRLAIIKDGRVVASSTYEELASQHPRVVRLVGARGDLPASSDEWRVVSPDDSPELVIHTTLQPEVIVQRLAVLQFDDVTIEPPSLEDVFLEYYE